MQPHPDLRSQTRGPKSEGRKKAEVRRLKSESARPCGWQRRANLRHQECRAGRVSLNQSFAALGSPFRISTFGRLSAFGLLNLCLPQHLNAYCW
jgi:hypothetical protein